MMLDWSAYQKQINANNALIGRANRDILNGYRQLSNAGATTNLLGAKTRELIALAVAVTRQCDGCIAVHTDAAIKEGATREEIVEALGVAVAVNAGAALIFSSRVRVVGVMVIDYFRCRREFSYSRANGAACLSSPQATCRHEKRKAPVGRGFWIIKMPRK